MFENGVFWEFYNEKDWIRRLAFVVDEQEKFIKLYKNPLLINEHILKINVLKITKNMLLIYVSEDNFFDDFSHHQLYIYCDFFEQK